MKSMRSSYSLSSHPFILARLLAPGIYPLLSAQAVADALGVHLSTATTGRIRVVLVGSTAGLLLLTRPMTHRSMTKIRFTAVLKRPPLSK
jgi:hypothetical protein